LRTVYKCKKVEGTYRDIQVFIGDVAWMRDINPGPTVMRTVGLFMNKRVDKDWACS
jgi:hypothetical protein